MNETVTQWYENNSQEIKLLQYIIYHLKKSGHTIKTKKKEYVGEVKVGIKIIPGEYTMSFD